MYVFFILVSSSVVSNDDLTSEEADYFVHCNCDFVRPPYLINNSITLSCLPVAIFIGVLLLTAITLGMVSLLRSSLLFFIDITKFVSTGYF